MSNNNNVKLVNGFKVYNPTYSYPNLSRRVDTEADTTFRQLATIKAVICRFKVSLRIPAKRYIMTNVISDLYAAIWNETYAIRDLSKEKGEPIITNDGIMCFRLNNGKVAADDKLLDMGDMGMLIVNSEMPSYETLCTQEGLCTVKMTRYIEKAMQLVKKYKISITLKNEEGMRETFKKIKAKIDAGDLPLRTDTDGEAKVIKGGLIKFCKYAPPVTEEKEQEKIEEEPVKELEDEEENELEDEEENEDDDIPELTLPNLDLLYGEV